MKRFDLCVAILGSILFGIAPIIGKKLLQNHTRYTIMFLISAIYFTCLLIGLPFFQHHLMKDLENMTVDDALLLLFQGVIILFVGNLTYYYVLRDNSSAIVNAIDSASPLITLLLAYWLLNEKIGPMGAVGIVLIVLGVLCISYNDKNIRPAEAYTSRD